jgi:hypothetical protein
VWPRKSSKKAAEKAAEGVVDTAADKNAKKAADKAAKKATQASSRAALAARAAVYQKPRADLYTFLLVVAWLALLVGILFLCLEMNAYDFKFKGGPTPPVGMIQYERPGTMHPGMAAPRQSDRMTVV